MHATSSISILAVAAALTSGVSAAPAGTACCTNLGDCTTVSGETESGLKWCYGYQNGLVEFTSADQSVSKCLTNLHFTQDSACITTAGSSCEGPETNIVSAHDSMLYGNHQISSDDSLAIQAAMDDAAATGLKWSDDTSKGPGYINFVHVADNGSGIRGIEIYNRNLC